MISANKVQNLRTEGFVSGSQRWVGDELLSEIDFTAAQKQGSVIYEIKLSQKCTNPSI